MSRPMPTHLRNYIFASLTVNMYLFSSFASSPLSHSLPFTFGCPQAKQLCWINNAGGGITSTRSIRQEYGLLPCRLDKIGTAVIKLSCSKLIDNTVGRIRSETPSAATSTVRLPPSQTAPQNRENR